MGRYPLGCLALWSFLRRSFVTWVYIWVDEISAWPSISWTSLKSAPRSRRCVAKEWRTMWGFIFLRSMLATRACFLIKTQKFCLVMGPPLMDKKRWADLLWPARTGLEASMYLLSHNMADSPMGTIRSLLPLPNAVR